MGRVRGRGRNGESGFGELKRGKFEGIKTVVLCCFHWFGAVGTRLFGPDRDASLRLSAQRVRVHNLKAEH